MRRIERNVKPRRGGRIGVDRRRWSRGRGRGREGWRERKTEPQATPAARQTTIPDAPPADSFEDVLARLRALEAIRRAETETRQKQMDAAADRAAIKALGRVLDKYGKGRAGPEPPKEQDDDERRSTDPSGRG